MDGRGRGARGGGARVEGVDATYAQYVTQEYTGLFEPDTRVRVRINNLVAYLETVQAGARVSDTGAVLFRAYYASRHGADARGAGPAATALRTLPPSLTAFATRNGGVLPRERLRQIIDGRGISSHGGRDMPVCGRCIQADARRSLRGCGEGAHRRDHRRALEPLLRASAGRTCQQACWLTAKTFPSGS